MNNFRQISEMHVNDLRQAVYKMDSLFVGHPELKEGELGYSHKDASIILLRYPPMSENIGNDVEEQKRVQDNLFSVWTANWPMFRHALNPLLYTLMEQVNGTHIGGIGIVKLPPGKVIQPHYDVGLCTKFYKRFHITVDGPENCWFSCGKEEDEERTAMLDGQVWWFDSHKLHSVSNESDTDRISVSVDISEM